MILQIIQQILGIILFFLPGILLSYIIAEKTNIIKRAVYSIVLAPCIAVLGGISLYFLNLLTAINIIIVLVSISILFLIIILNSNKKHKTDFNSNIFSLVLFSLVGVFWRLRFLRSIKNFTDSYEYSYQFGFNKVPDLGFYTGMAIDHSRFIGIRIFYKILNFLSIEKIVEFLGIFLIIFLFLGFTYLIFLEYRNRKLALIGIVLMSLGPIEIFHATTGFFGHPFSYLVLFSLFLLYKVENKKYFLIPLLLSATMMFTYVTSSMVTFLVSIGFIIALLLKVFMKKNKKLSKIKILAFILIAIVSALFLLGSYSFGNSEEKSSNLELVTKHIISSPLMKYKDPTFLGLSAIRWQMVFFFLCGLTFVFYITKRLIEKENISENNLDLLLCLIPILIVSSAFWYANLQTRIFDYFAFFGLLVLKIPRKYLKIFFILSFIFLLITGFYVAEDKKVFFETSDGEIEGALWIDNSLQGRVFSDQVFVNQLVLKGYYNVTGVYDNDPLVYDLFYQDNLAIFLIAINTLREDLNVDYVVITKRMQDKYILMIDVPQKRLINSDLYEQLNKIYDNGDVKVYHISELDGK